MELQDLKTMSFSRSILLGIFFVVCLCLSTNGYAAKVAPADDDESVVSMKSKSMRVLSKGSIAQFKTKKVEVAEGTTDTLGNIAKVVFAEQSKFQAKLSKIKTSSKILLQNPKFTNEAYEYADSFVLVKSTQIIVVDPVRLAKASPQFKSFLGQKSKKKAEKMTREAREGMMRYISEVLPTRLGNDPLKIAYTKGGEKALIDAIVEGKGLFETIEEVVIPKKLPPRINGIPQLRSVKNLGFNFNKYQSSKFPPIRKISPDKRSLANSVANKLKATPQILKKTPAPTKMTSVVKTGARENIQSKFLTGYTLGADFFYRKTWKYRSGLFRVELGAGYTIGLRFPVQATTAIEPTKITTSGRKDVPTTFKTSLSTKPVNGDCAYYKEVGLNEGEETCGKELALDFYFGYGYKFRALWTTVRHRPYEQLHTPPWSKDFTPPYNNNGGGLSVWIPPSITQTTFGVGPVLGWLKAGFLLSGTGTVDLGYEAFAGNTTIKSQTLTFRSPNEVSFTNTIPAMEQTSGTTPVKESYGYKLLGPVYKIHPTITPGVQVSVRLGYGSFSRRIGTGAIWVNSLKTSLPSKSFPTHEGTISEHGYDRGKKTFNPR